MVAFDERLRDPVTGLPLELFSWEEVEKELAEEEEKEKEKEKLKAQIAELLKKAQELGLSPENLIK